ncbi:MAG: hypothetical protein H0X11_12480 [Betaproteobacteria bacterium]|nr:hypothetical protein [Betaproteobacteria bacterium]
MLELEWVLRNVAEQPATNVIDCLVHLVGLPEITVELRLKLPVRIPLG